MIESEKGTFSPMVFLTTGGAGPESTVVLKRLAEMSTKKIDGPSLSPPTRGVELHASTLCAVLGNAPIWQRNSPILQVKHPIQAF